VFLQIQGTGAVYVSADTGLTWAYVTLPSQQLSNLAMSADGNQLVGIVDGGGIQMWRFIAPFIASEPQSQTVPGAINVEFSVGAFTIASLQYQWLFNDAPLQNATNSTLTLTNVTPFQAGSYSVLVSNAFGNTLSSNASLTVVPALLTTQSPDPSLYDANLTASITTGSDSTAVWFQWGVSTNYGQVTPAIILQGANALNISNLITGLTPYTTYHYQAVASNIFGTALGGDVSFTTVPKFVQVGTNTGWSALVLSGDGRELVGTIGGIIYVSTNVGAEFTPTTGTGSVFATSSNGSVILAVNGSNIYASVDRGSTWMTNSAPAAFSRFAASSDAQNLVASDGSINVYTSTNFGATWKGSTVPWGPSCLASSADGTQLYAGTYTWANPETPFGWVYGSANSGKTWSTIYEFFNFIGLYSIACSADGSIIAVAGEGTEISINGGASWYGLYPMGANSIASSADGQTLIVNGENSGVQVSPNTGASWYAPNPPYLFGSVKASADGNTLAILDSDNDLIYLSQPSPSQPFALSVATNAFNGLPTFQLTGQSGFYYTVQASTNLVGWTNIAVLANTNGTVPFTDTAATNYNRRFYRAVAP
jgi:hypothetical protein